MGGSKEGTVLGSVHSICNVILHHNHTKAPIFFLPHSSTFARSDNMLDIPWLKQLGFLHPTSLHNKILYITHCFSSKSQLLDGFSAAKCFIIDYWSLSVDIYCINFISINDKIIDTTNCHDLCLLLYVEAKYVLKLCSLILVNRYFKSPLISTNNVVLSIAKIARHSDNLYSLVLSYSPISLLTWPSYNMNISGESMYTILLVFIRSLPFCSVWLVSLQTV